MKKSHSRIGLIVSLAIHGTLIAGSLAWLDNHKTEHHSESNTLSMELVAALLEQPQVAVAPSPVTEDIKEIEEVKPDPEPDAIVDPVLPPKKEKPKEERRKKHHQERKEHRKEHRERKERDKERPKRKPEHKPIKALERGLEAKQGIVAKAMPGAIQGNKVVAGVVGGQKNGSLNSTSTTGSANGVNGGNASELAAYKAALQRALQRRANNAYPQREKMMRKTGTVTIKFTVLPSGAISNVSVVNSSGNHNLDAAAVRSAEGMKVAPPPAGFPSQVTVPVRFSIS